MDVPGSFNSPNSSFNVSMELNTPIKKLNTLNLNSDTPFGDIFQDNVTTSMLNKGYSKKLTNNVLQELNLRAQNIDNIDTSIKSDTTTRRNKRYSQIHKQDFKEMASINSHYSVKELAAMKNEKDSTHDSKRRRTLLFDDMITYKPVQSEKLNSNPLRKLSPSKKFINLNEMLNKDEHSSKQLLKDDNSKPAFEFKTPYPPTNRLRYSSLEMAGVKSLEPLNGVKSETNLNFFHHSTSTLNPKSSIPALNTKSSIPTLNKKLSIQSINKPVPALQHKSSIPSLQKKASFSNLNSSEYIKSGIKQSPSTKSFNQPLDPKLRRTSLSPSKIHTHNSTSSRSYSDPTVRSRSLSPSKSLYSVSYKSQSNYQSQIPTSSEMKPPVLSTISPSKQNSPSFLSKLSSSKTYHSLKSIPSKNLDLMNSQPSLYNKPTISSSQKSLNTFQRFKSRFD